MAFTLCSEPRLELHAPDLGLVEETGQIVEIDCSNGNHLIGNVSAEQRRLVCSFAPRVAQADSALEQLLAGKFGGFVEEEVHFTAIGPIGVSEEFAAAEGDAISQREVRNPLGRLRQRIAVDHGEAADYGVGDRAGKASAHRDTVVL